MLGALTVPDIETPSTALVPSSTDMVVMDNDTQGNSLSPMSPMDSLKAIFEDMAQNSDLFAQFAQDGAGGLAEAGVTGWIEAGGRLGIDAKWEHCILVFDGEGNVIESWSQWDSMLQRPHYVAINPYDSEKHGSERGLGSVGSSE